MPHKIGATYVEFCMSMVDQSLKIRHYIPVCDLVKIGVYYGSIDIKQLKHREACIVQ